MSSIRSASRRGATAVEFALVALPLVFVIGGICETGVFLFIQDQLLNASEDAARLIQLNTVTQPTVWAIDTYRTEVCKKLFVSSCASTLKIDVRNVPIATSTPPNYFKQLETIMPDVNSVGPAAPGANYQETFQPGSRGQVGSLILTYDWSFVFPFMSTFFGNVPGNPQVRRLSAVSIFRNEL